MESARKGENIVDSEGAEVGSRPEAADLEFYQTQYSLLEARSLAERVAAELRLAENEQYFEMFGEDPNARGLFAEQVGRDLTSEQRAARQKIAVDILLENKIGRAHV